jgi:hypothetical protein
MKKIVSLLSISLFAAGLLSACGGDNDTPSSPNGGSNLNAGGSGGAPGTVQGNIADIVGDYEAMVVKADCLPEDAGPGETIEAQANGACKITSSGPTGSTTELRRDILPAGAYTVRVASDGSVEFLVGSASKAKITCPSTPNSVCMVTGSIYTMAGATANGAAGANIGISQFIFDKSAKPKSVSGLVYGLGSNVSFATGSTDPRLASESGVIAFGN